MLTKTNNLIVKSISDVFKIERNQIQSQLELRQCPKTDLPEFQFHINKNAGLVTKQIDSLIHLIKANYDKTIIENVSLDVEKSTPKVVFKLNQKHFINDVLSSTRQNIELENKKRVVVEFSSPNIAKPFHVGHLRSTIIGNFIANLNKCVGNEVVKLNYLGDWGTQFGMLQIGIEMSDLSDVEIQKNPIEKMYQSYVLANNAAKSNPKIIENARMLFTELETEKYSMQRKRWERFRKYTIDELRATYSRLGIVFDQYDWESQYSQKNIQNVIQQLEDSGVLKEEVDGRKIIEIGDRRVPVIKSNGSTLYLVRDIAALLDRYERYKFDKIFYIVDNAQTDHFKALFCATPNIVKDLQNRTIHVKFGRIKGMSTRSGNAVFLKDVLNEARDIMLTKQNESPTTKVNLDYNKSEVADVLGISAVIINDLKQKRQKDYDFNWDKILQVNGDTGIKLQYTHCRLVSLLENVSIKAADEPNYKLLGEKDALTLILILGKYPETLRRSLETLEACILVNYLFSLSNSINRALKRLNVIHEKSSEVQAQRVLLFKQSKSVLNSGMNILGLQPLNKM